MSKVETGRVGLGIRGDHLYCPLCFSVEPYRWCEPNCPHCFFRGLDSVWNNSHEFNPVDIDALRARLESGLRNKNPKSILSQCIAQKKTIKIGNKADPFQPIENTYHTSKNIIKLLMDMEWSFVIQTRFPYALLNWIQREKCADRFAQFGTVLVVISPGLSRDWDILECRKTQSIGFRISSYLGMRAMGIRVGVQGEPFIPGFHRINDFRETVRYLRANGVKAYSTYNFHFTPHVAKRLVEIPEVDIERIWKYNQDDQWKRILQKLIKIADEEHVKLGCPDFVNSGKDYVEPFNTCCGINVSNPCMMNTHYFKRCAQKGYSYDRIIRACNDGTASLEEAEQVIRGTTDEFYTLRDAGWEVK